MIIYNDIEKNNELKNIEWNKYYILTDFDGTMTVGTGDSSWSTIFKNPLVTKEFINECINIYGYYHKYEIDTKISLEEKNSKMKEWYEKNIETLIKYNITKDIINFASNNKELITFRDGAKKLLKVLHRNNVPVIIISAGVGNIIEQFLINNECYFDNIYITSNFLEYENNKVSGVKNNNLIHSLNKSEISLSEELKEKISNRKCLLLGDNVMDIKMHTTENDIVKIGFLDERIEDRVEEFKANYDIVATNNTSFIEVFGKDRF